MSIELRMPLLTAIAVVIAAGLALNWATKHPGAEANSAEGFSLAEEYTIPVPPTPPGSENISAPAHALIENTFFLSAEKRLNEEYGVELMDVAEDGTTRIRVVLTKNILSAKPGTCFSSEEFGESGLLLKGGYPTSQSATFVRTICVEVFPE